MPCMFNGIVGKGCEDRFLGTLSHLFKNYWSTVFFEFLILKYFSFVGGYGGGGGGGGRGGYGGGDGGYNGYGGNGKLIGFKKCDSHYT